VYTTYDANHDVLTSVDANNNTTTNTYQYIGPNGYSGASGVSGTVGQVVEEDQSAIQPYVPGNGLTVTPTITHTYDPTTHDLIATKLPEGGLTTYTYDGYHSVVGTAAQTTCPGCGVSWQGTINQYDQYGERTSTIDGCGVDATNGAPTPNGQATAYTSHMGYSPQGDLLSQSTPPLTATLGGVTQTASAVTTSYTYDGDGNRQTMISANGNASASPRSYTTSYGYDHLGRQTALTLPAITLYNNTTTAPVQTTGYDADGNVVRTTDANGHSTTSSYDPEGRQVSTTNPVSGTSLMTYTASELTAQQDAQGNVTAYGYDAAGRQIQTTDPATGTVQTAYDAAGNTVAMTTTDRTTGNAAVTLQVMGYDAQNRAITTTVVTNTANVVGSALTTLTAYDQDGNVAQTQQSNGDVVYNLYDAADRLTNVEIDPAPLTKAQAATHPSYEAYGYDAAGNQTVAVDADNRVTTSQYDGDNRATQSVAASAAPTGTTTITTTSQYDPDGNTLRQTTQTVDSTTPGQGQTSTVANTYNAADWETSTTVDGLTTSYGYDAAGQQTTESTSDGATALTTGYDPEGRVTSIAENAGGGGPYTARYGYTPDDLPQTMAYPNGVNVALGYDANSQLTRLTALGPPNQVPATTTLASGYAYGYNAAGWITSTTTLSGTDALTHDASGRLTDECGPQMVTRDHCDHWTYDKNGNLRTAIGDAGVTDVYTYSVTQINEQVAGGASDSPPTATISLAYDGHGDTTSISNPVALTDPTSAGYKKYALNESFAYDAEQRPIQATRLESTKVGTATIVTPLTATIQYNADGLRSDYLLTPDPRTGKQPVDTRFAYRDGALASATVTDNSGALLYKNTFIYGPSGEPLELIRTDPTGTHRFWYVLDGLGSVVALTDQNGKVVDRYAYDSWGEPTSDDRTNETVPQQLRYAGYYYDEKLTYYWVSVRYYDPEGMRWFQPDPSDQDGVHTYAYVNDDPLDEADPSGLCTITLHFQPALQSLGENLPIGVHTFITLNDNRDRNLYWLFEGTRHQEGRGATTGHILGGANGEPESPYPQVIARSSGGSFQDTRPFLQPSLTVVHDNLNCYCYISRFIANAKAIDRLNLRYEQLVPTQAGNPLFPINSDAYAYTVLTHHTGIHVSSRLWRNPDGSISQRPTQPPVFGSRFSPGSAILDAPGWGRDLLDPHWHAPS